MGTEGLPTAVRLPEAGETCGTKCQAPASAWSRDQLAQNARVSEKRDTPFPYASLLRDPGPLGLPARETRRPTEPDVELHSLGVDVRTVRQRPLPGESERLVAAVSNVRWESSRNLLPSRANVLNTTERTLSTLKVTTPLGVFCHNSKQHPAPHPWVRPHLALRPLAQQSPRGCGRGAIPNCHPQPRCNRVTSPVTQATPSFCQRF